MPTWFAWWNWRYLCTAPFVESWLWCSVAILFRTVHWLSCKLLTGRGTGASHLSLALDTSDRIRGKGPWWRPAGAKSARCDCPSLCCAHLSGRIKNCMDPHKFVFQVHKNYSRCVIIWTIFPTHLFEKPPVKGKYQIVIEQKHVPQKLELFLQ